MGLVKYSNTCFPNGFSIYDVDIRPDHNIFLPKTTSIQLSRVGIEHNLNNNLFVFLLCCICFVYLRQNAFSFQVT